MLFDAASQKCFLKLREGYDGNFHLGVPFFTAYYTIFDIDNQEISLCKINKNIKFNKETLDTHSEVDKSNEPVLNTEDKDGCTSDDFCWEQLKTDGSIRVSGDSSSERYK